MARAEAAPHRSQHRRQLLGGGAGGPLAGQLPPAAVAKLEAISQTPKPAIAFVEALPQGLKPLFYSTTYGTAEAVP